MLTDREKLVLNAIIDFYLRFGETIGSRTLVKRYSIDLSSATIRNVMSDLEDRGFIEKTHSSSGRIPTDLGYKYYLSELLKIEKLSREERNRINIEYEKKVNELDSILQKTSSLLSKLTTYASIVIEPDYRKERIKKIELVHIDDYIVLAIIVTEDLSVVTKKIKLEESITKEEVEKLSKTLNEKIKTNTIKSYEIETFIKNNYQKYSEIEKEIYQDIEGRLYVDNSSSIFKDKNVSDVLDVLEMFNKKKDIKDIFEDIIESHGGVDGQVNVILGDELPIKGLEDYSFVYSVYKQGDSKGVIGVIGPKRMPYSKTMGLIQYVSSEVEKAINGEKLLVNKKNKNDKEGVE